MHGDVTSRIVQSFTASPVLRHQYYVTSITSPALNHRNYVSSIMLYLHIASKTL